MIHNPILSGFHPDPSILRVGEVYYLVTSTFEWLPGLPMYRSTDLEHWELVCHALTKDIGIKGVQSACGVWAPALSYCPENQLYYMTYSVIWGFDHNNFDAENYVMTAKEPTGPWTNPQYLSSSGFDPSLFHDESGKSYLVSLEWEFRQGYTHPGRIVLQEFCRETQQLVGEVYELSRGATTRGCAEGPHLYLHKGYYYLLIAEGGTGYGHCITVSRSKQVTGPYEPSPDGPLLTSCRENFDERGVPNSAKPWRYEEGEYLQKSGHGILVETLEGETYCVHLCSRPITSQHASVLGRETAIQKCKWENDWVYLEHGDCMAQEYVPAPKMTINLRFPNIPPQEGVCHDDFSKGIPLYYYAPRSLLEESWVHSTETGLLLRGQGTLFTRYNVSLVARKVNGFSYQVDTRLECIPQNHLQMAGLTHYYNNQNFYYLRMYYSESLKGMALGILEGNHGERREHLESRVALLPQEGIYLRGVVEEEVLQYFYSYDNQIFYPIGRTLDMTLLSDEATGGFTGTFVGLTATDLDQNRWQAKFDFLTYTIRDKERKKEGQR